MALDGHESLAGCSSYFNPLDHGEKTIEASQAPSSVTDADAPASDNLPTGQVVLESTGGVSAFETSVFNDFDMIMGIGFDSNLLSETLNADYVFPF